MNQSNLTLWTLWGSLTISEEKSNMESISYFKMLYYYLTLCQLPLVS